MARLFRQAFGQRTYDEGETSMRELGATGVFRNLAFQENVEEVVTTPKRAIPCNKDVPTEPASNAAPLSPACPETLQGTEMWASPPTTPSHASAVKRTNQMDASMGLPSSPSGGKRAAGLLTCQTPKAHRLSLTKPPKNVTEVEEIAARDVDLANKPTLTETGENGAAQVEPLVVAAPWTLASPHARSGTPNAVRMWEEEVKRLLLAGRMEDAVRYAAPSEGMIRCTVRRLKNFMGQTQAYHLFLDSGDTFLLAARKRKKSASSNYVLSTSQEDLGRDSEHRIAKLHSNFVGTEYSLVSRGHNATVPWPGNSGNTGRPGNGVGSNAAVRPESPDEDTPAPAAEIISGGSSRQHQSLFGQEEMAVHYKQTVLTAKGGPRVMLVATPLPETNWAPSASDGSDSLAGCLNAARRRELPPRLERQLCMLASRPPEWDPALKAYTLDFHGRVRASSVKNFQLVHWDHNTDRKGADIVLQFGKMDDHGEDYALDFAYPLTVQKAFGIALASTDAKLCYAL
ncbi:hypothetical protein Vretimale_8326 [Volvox reticuliferus]|uniref:Tubby C-terminal domain-containing protein n=1 Tax=Volvox reticuliferus TaxID=1737510 RepID=A0A8J4GAJ5_9CHLO|nr:hypothetical protein Vretimale_8326 [Volvox reticuliferus]